MKNGCLKFRSKRILFSAIVTTALLAGSPQFVFSEVLEEHAIAQTGTSEKTNCGLPANKAVVTIAEKRILFDLNLRHPFFINLNFRINDIFIYTVSYIRVLPYDWQISDSQLCGKRDSMPEKFQRLFYPQIGPSHIPYGAVLKVELLSVFHDAINHRQ